MSGPAAVRSRTDRVSDRRFPPKPFGLLVSVIASCLFIGPAWLHELKVRIHTKWNHLDLFLRAPDIVAQRQRRRRRAASRSFPRHTNPASKLIPFKRPMLQSLSVLFQRVLLRHPSRAWRLSTHFTRSVSQNWSMMTPSSGAAVLLKRVANISAPLPSRIV
jgi:hypothetical protein